MRILARGLALILAAFPVLAVPDVVRPAGAQSAPALRLPGAGRVTAVIETRHRDGFDQRIAYEGGDGRNHAEIALRNETGDLLLAFPPRLAKPSEFGITGEIAVRFPGETMRVQTVPRRNAYGPVGLALGADCLYAWQWFERPRRGAQVASRDGIFGTADSTAPRRALSLRIRLCRTAQASLDDLVAAVQHLTIALPGDGAVRAPAAPRPAPRRRVAKPAPRPAPAEPTPEARPAPPPERPRPQQAEPPPSRPAVPVPPPAEGGRRYLAPRTPEARPPEAPPTPEAAPRSGSQRYITDGPQPAEPPGATPTPSPAPGRGAGETLSRDLPPEAYRPPPDRAPGR